MQVLSSSQYKYTTFFAQIQIPLTFRNTLAKVKMQQFAADGGWRVLYYEEHMAGSIPRHEIGGAEGWATAIFFANERRAAPPVSFSPTSNWAPPKPRRDKKNAKPYFHKQGSALQTMKKLYL